MNAPNPEERIDPIDEATANRLAKLRTMPVDISRIEESLHSQIPGGKRSGTRRLWIGPMQAIAASVALAVVLAGIFLATAARPVQASPREMAQVYRDLVSGQGSLAQPISIEQANARLAAAGAADPNALPAMSDCEVMACCRKSIGNKKMSCAMVRGDGATLSLVVARAKDVRPPDSSTVVRDGVTYHVSSSDSINMVMVERQSRWLCVMGEQPTEKLLDVAAGLKF